MTLLAREIRDLTASLGLVLGFRALVDRNLEWPQFVSVPNRPPGLQAFPLRHYCPTVLVWSVAYRPPFLVCIHRRPRRALSAPAIQSTISQLRAELRWQSATVFSSSARLSTRARRHGGPGTDHLDRPPSAFTVCQFPSNDVTLAPHNLLIGARRCNLPAHPHPTLLTPPTHNFVRPIPLRGRGNPVQSPNSWEEHVMHEHAPADKAACQLIHTPLGRVPNIDTP